MRDPIPRASHVNFGYCHPVGHAVEAVQYCLGYRRADPDRRIGVVLKANTAVEIASWCEHIDEVYTVDFDVFTAPDGDVLDHVPAEWDWVVDDPRGHQQWQHALFPGWPVTTPRPPSTSEPGMAIARSARRCPPIDRKPS
jgi:hypothetical protein